MLWEKVTSDKRIYVMYIFGILPQLIKIFCYQALFLNIAGSLHNPA